MRIAIVDDELSMRKQLMKQISNWIINHKTTTAMGTSIICEDFCDGESLLESAAYQKYDLVFLDIYMHKKNGIETASQLHQWDKQCVIIFLTSSKDHMPDAFSVHAFEYLLKPIEETKLQRVLEEATSMIPELQRVLPLPMGRNTVPVLYSSIRYILADSQYCMVYMDESCRCRTSFGKLTELLVDDPRFLVINRGVLVNMDYVMNMEGNVCRMSNGLQLPINTRNSSKIRQALTEYRFACRARLLTGGMRL